MFCAQVFGTTMRALSLNELTIGANTIVAGKVLSSTSFRRNGRIYTKNKIQITEKISSQTQNEIIEVETIGGRIGNIVQKVIGAAELKKGDEYLLFLRNSANKKMRVLGMSQGAYSITKDNNTNNKMLMPSKINARLVKVDAQTGNLADSPSWIMEPKPLRDIISRINTVLKCAK